MGVLDAGLKKNGTGWLVGDKLTYADLSFVTWAGTGDGILKELGKAEGMDEKYPDYTRWMNAMRERPVAKRIQEEIAKGRAAHSLPKAAN